MFNLPDGCTDPDGGASDLYVCSVCGEGCLEREIDNDASEAFTHVCVKCAEQERAQHAEEDEQVRAAHTPGPWAFHDRRHVNGSILIYAEQYAIANTCVGDDEQALHNARLIAAAPAMLEALRDMLEVYTSQVRIMHPQMTLDKIKTPPVLRARAAIALATMPTTNPLDNASRVR